MTTLPVSEQESMNKMKRVYQAILTHRKKTGAYPVSLQALAPAYIDSDQLHCRLDTVPDPHHVTFLYTRPPASATTSANFWLLSFQWKQEQDAGTVSGKMEQNLNGSISESISKQMSAESAR